MLKTLALMQKNFLFRQLAKITSYSAQKVLNIRQAITNPSTEMESMHRINNPRYNFVEEQRSFVDYIKYIVFMYGHWITLVMVLSAGLGGTSLFALGYLIFCSLMLWKGNKPYTMTVPSTLMKWKMLLLYNVFTMFSKIILQLFGCAFITLLKGLYPLQQLFSIICVKDLSHRNLDTFFTETGFGFDLAAFVFIIFQLTLYDRISVRSRPSQSIVEKEMREQSDQQNKKFREIKDRTASIRKRYEEQQKRSIVGMHELHIQSPRSYAQAKRAGDYYMFEDTDDPVNDASGRPSRKSNVQEIDQYSIYE